MALFRAMRGLVSATVLTAGCLSLGGCLGLPAASGPLNTAAAPEPPKSAAADKHVDDVTKHILQAAGLDPSDPSQPKDIARNVAGVVQVRYQGRNYGTALAKPSPGLLQFTDPNAVAVMLAGSAGKAKLAAALRSPLVDIDSRDCRFNQKHDRKTRKAFRLPRVCPSASGAIWADLNRREMVVELKMAGEYAAIVRPPGSEPAITDASPGFAPPTTVAAVNLFSEPAAPTVETSLPAAAPISLKPPVRLTAAEPASEAQAAPSSPWGALLAPTRTASQPVLLPPPAPLAQAESREVPAPAKPTQHVVLPPLSSPEPGPAAVEPAPAPQVPAVAVQSGPAHAAPAAPAQIVTVSSAPSRSELPPPVLAVSSYSASSAAGGEQARLFSSSNPVREVDGAYSAGRSGSDTSVSVISGAYRPRSSDGFR